MIVLNTQTRSLQVVLAGAKNTNDAPFVANWIDYPNSPAAGAAGEVPGATPGTTNGVTAVTIMAAPGMYPQYSRKLKSFNLNNADLAAITVSILYNDNGTTYALFKCILQTLEQLTYEDGFGFEALDANGAIKSQAAATSSATSLAQSSADSAGTRASVADSKALSVSSNTSIADSKAVSDSVVISTNLSTQTSANTSLSTNISAALSAAISDSVNISTAQSGVTSGSTGLSTLTSRVSSKGG